MLVKIFNHFRLTFRLVRDRRVRFWLKLFLFGLPVGYALIPLPDDLIPGVGLLDDALFFVISTLIFQSLCPQSVVSEHRRAIAKLAPGQYASLDACRHPAEVGNLASGFAVIFVFLALVGWLGGLIGFGLFLLGYFLTLLQRREYLSNVLQVGERQLPELNDLLAAAQAQLPPVKVNLFVSQNPVMNAFTFGYQEPYTIVLTSALVEKLNPDETRAVIGHELGHILFGHVRLTTLMGGLGGPLRMLFLRWIRACEYSADAVALRACSGQVEPVVSALVKLSSGLSGVPIDLKSFLAQSNTEEKGVGRIAEKFSSHPYIDNRIRRLAALPAL